MTTAAPVSPIRAGAFDHPDDVATAIEQLHAAGFRSSEIHVVTSDPEAARRFASYIHEKPAGARTGKALSQAAVVYVVLAAIGIGVGLFSSGTTTLLSQARCSGSPCW